MALIDNWSESQKQECLKILSDWVEEYNVCSGEQAAQSDEIQISGSVLVNELADVIGLGYED